MKYSLLALALISSPLVAADLKDVDRKELVRIIERLEDKQTALDNELNSLRALLGLDSTLADLEPLKAKDDMSQRVKVRIEDGIRAFQKGEYDKAKDSFQLAWEEAPEEALTHYNLGIAYHKQGNQKLAKRMLQTAIEKQPSLDDAGHIADFIASKGERKDKKPTSRLESKRTQLTNLRNEAESYLRSSKLTLPEKMSRTSDVLSEMVALIGEEKELKQDFLSEVADRYAALEHYQRALELYRDYEIAMHGKLLPEGFFRKVQDLEAREEALKATLKGYIGNTIDDRKVARRVTRDLEELKIFATQMDRFVKEMDDKDTDFRKICRRLKEFRWGGRSDRHVLVLSRHQELLYSSLSGTLPIDRYQDVDGNKFLKNITLLADQLEYKQAEHFTVDLNVRGQKTPYFVFYTYIPKHEAFIVVRLPKSDLA